MLAVAFPIYVVWLLYYFGTFGLTIIGATLIAYAALDVVAFLTAASVEAGEPLHLLLYVPLYTGMQISVMRAIRIFAIGQELILRSSYRDPYVPERVMRTVERV